MNKLLTLFVFGWFSLGLSGQITLGPTVSTFAVLGGSAVTNTGATSIGGNLGVSPSAAITGFPPGLVSGTIHSADATAAQAQLELTTAYNAAFNLPCPPGNVLTGIDLGGLTLSPGVYCFAASAQLTGTLTLNALGNPNAQFVFQIGTALTTASGSAVVLINQAEAANVFFQTGTSTTFGSTSAVVGNFMALASISFGNQVSLQGRALARNGAVTLIGDNISISNINVPVGPGGPGAPAATPAPSSLLLITIGLVCVGVYQTRQRVLGLIRGGIGSSR